MEIWQSCIRVEWCSTFWYFRKRAHCCRSGLFFIFKFLKIVEFGGDHSGRTAKFSFRILVVYFRVIVKIKKLKNIISNLNLGIGGLYQFCTTWKVPVCFSLPKITPPYCIHPQKIHPTAYTPWESFHPSACTPWESLHPTLYTPWESLHPTAYTPWDSI